MSSERISVLVADDHPVFRDGVAMAVRRRPELELIGAAEDGRTALARIRALTPTVALVDVNMPLLTGGQVLNAVIRDRIPTCVVLLSATVEDSDIDHAIAAGAFGILSKQVTRDAICDAVVAAARGKRQRQVVSDAPIQQRPLLSPRELEVLRLTADGQSAPQIGRTLELSPETVKTHLRNSYTKLKVSDRAAAVAEGMRRGLLE